MFENVLVHSASQSFLLIGLSLASGTWANNFLARFFETCSMQLSWDNKNKTGRASAYTVGTRDDPLPRDSHFNPSARGVEGERLK
jgi:hypothetical protein